MTGSMRVDDLDPLTRRSIERTRRANHPRSYDCGCWPTVNGRIYLCHYHQGVQAGIALAREDRR